MYLLTGAVVLLACNFFAAIHAETCTQISTCVSYVSNMESVSKSGDSVAVCAMLGKFSTCIESAKADCVAKGVTLAPEVEVQLESMAPMQTTMDQMCTPGADTNSGTGTNTVPKNAKCLDIPKCIFDVNELTEAAKAGDSRAVCGILGPSVACMQSALDDCRATKTLTEEQLKQGSEQLAKSTTLYSQHCGSSGDSNKGDGTDGATGINQSFMFLAMVSFFAIALAHLF